jgi:hypothetical protein
VVTLSLKVELSFAQLVALAHIAAAIVTLFA